jgi:hypothetical protein
MSGPNYNYSKHIASIKDLSISPTGNIFQLFDNVSGFKYYIDTILWGGNKLSSKKSISPLGQNYFIRSGNCGKQSSNGCSGKPRYIYVRNVPTGKIPCLGKYSPQTDFKGLIPGMIEDTADINPMNLINNALGKGAQINDTCILQTLPVGPTSTYYPNGEVNETRCSPRVRAPDCMPTIGELYTNYETKNKINKNIKRNDYRNIYILILILIMLFILFIKK